MIDRLPRATVAPLVLGLILVASGDLRAIPGPQQTPLPPARQIVTRFVAAMGGEAAYRAVKSIHARGTMEIAGQQIRGDLELFSARPARALYRVTVPGIGRIEQGYNGTVA